MVEATEHSHGHLGQDAVHAEPIRLSTWTLNKQLSWTLTPSSPKAVELKVFCPLEGGQYTEDDLKVEKMMNDDGMMEDDWMGQQRKPYLDWSFLHLRRNNESSKWELSQPRKMDNFMKDRQLCVRSSLRLLWLQALNVLHLSYHEAPYEGSTGNSVLFKQVVKFVSISRSTAPRSACLALYAWEALRRTLVTREEPENDYDIVVPWEDEIIRFADPKSTSEDNKNTFHGVRNALDSVVLNLRGKCKVGLPPPPQEGEWQLQSEQGGDLSARWFSERKTSQEKIFDGSNIDVEWSGELIRVRTWVEDKAALPRRLTADTHEVSSVLVGGLPKESRSGVLAINESASWDEDIKEIIKHLRSLSIPVCTLQTGQGTVRTLSRGNQWLRDFGFIFKGNASEQVPVMYGLTTSVEKPWNVDGQNMSANDDLDAIEGGNLLGTGTGACLTTRSFLPEWKTRPRPLDESRHRQTVIKQMYALGCHTMIFTDVPKRETTKHLDVFVGQVNDTVFVSGVRDVRDDPLNSMKLYYARRLLEKLGKEFRFQVEAIPMPPAFSYPDNAPDAEVRRQMVRRRACWLLDLGQERKCTFAEGDCCNFRDRTDQKWRWRSHTNFLPLHYNGSRMVLVPRFTVQVGNAMVAERVAEIEKSVTGVLRPYFDKVEWIRQEERVTMGGSLHCLTRAVPTGAKLQCPPL